VRTAQRDKRASASAQVVAYELLQGLHDTAVQGTIYCHKQQRSPECAGKPQASRMARNTLYL